MYCYLCQEEFVYFKTYCSECEKIKRIINVYSKTEVLGILERVCLRKSEKLQNYKIKDIKKDIDTIKEEKKEIKKEKNEFDDDTYINTCQLNNNIGSLNKNMICELKKRLG